MIEKVEVNRFAEDGTMSKKASGGSSETDNYLQIFIYRVPKKNHDAMVQLQDKLVSKWAGAGILDSEFFQLTKAEMVKGFMGLGETVSVRPDEDLWIEMQRYRDREHRDKIFDIIRKDSGWLQLFGQFYGLVTPGQNGVMGDLKKLRI